MRKQSIIAVTASLGALAALAVAADWPQWRGPGRDGISKETGLLKEWPKEGPKLLWQLKDIGDGYSTPAVVGGRIFLMSNRGMENEFVQALSVEDGKAIWQTRVGNVGNPNQQPPYPTARSTPTLDGNVLYALGSDGDLVSMEVATGKVLWKKSLRADFEGKPGKWAYAESPLVDADVLVVTPGGSQATMVALNKKTGALLWKASVPQGDPAGYSSVMAVEGGGRKQYVTFVDKGLVGVDAKTGQFLWRYDQTGKSAAANMPTPIVKDGYVYTPAQNIAGGLVQLAPAGDGVTAKEVYFTRDLPNKNGGSILLGDYLYGANSQGLVAAEFLTGKIKWQAEGVGPGSIFYADGHFYIHGENEEVALVEATPDAYREKGRFMPVDAPKHARGAQEKAWPHPVVANGRLYIRDLATLWCYDVKAK